MTIVKFTLDPKNPPVLSPELQDVLDNMQDDQIDYSDIPELPDSFWTQDR